MYVCICIITLTCYLAMPPYGWESFAHVLMRLILRLLAVDVQALSVLVSIVRGTSALCEKRSTKEAHMVVWFVIFISEQCILSPHKCNGGLLELQGFLKFQIFSIEIRSFRNHF